MFTANLCTFIELLSSIKKLFLSSEQKLIIKHLETREKILKMPKEFIYKKHHQQIIIEKKLIFCSNPIKVEKFRMFSIYKKVSSMNLLLLSYYYYFSYCESSTKQINIKICVFMTFFFFFIFINNFKTLLTHLIPQISIFQDSSFIFYNSK